MQSVAADTTVRVGNHSLSAAEAAAGVPARLPFVDPNGVAMDPTSVRIWLHAATGTVRSFSWPTSQTGDTGLVLRQAVGRFYVDWAPDDPEDGVWRWALLGVGAPTATASVADQDLFYVKRPVLPKP